MALLTGTETLYVLPQDATGSPAASTELVSAAHVAGSASRVCTTQVDRATSTTLTNITGLSTTLKANSKYIFRAHITGTATANGGAKFAIAGDGTLSATTFTATCTNVNGSTTNARTTTTTLGNAVGAATSVLTDAYIEGAISVNVGGVMSVQIAQNASHSDTTSAYVLSDLIVLKIT